MFDWSVILSCVNGLMVIFEYLATLHSVTICLLEFSTQKKGFKLIFESYIYPEYQSNLPSHR
jgi:hypothetical protein